MMMTNAQLDQQKEPADEMALAGLRQELEATESPLERALLLLGDRHSLMIIQSLRQFEPRRFLELQEQLPGVSTRTLTKRLKMLEEVGILSRRQFMEMPPRVEYRLTDIGHAIGPVVDQLMAWVNTHYPYRPQTVGEVATALV